MPLQLVHRREVACVPWMLADFQREPVFFATCRQCERDVAQVESSRGDVPICIYCGLDSGLVPPVDVPLFAEHEGGTHGPA